MRRNLISVLVSNGKGNEEFQRFLFSVIVPDCCQGNRAHYDLSLAKEMQLAQGGRGDYLVLHLAELVRVAFMAATSESDPLRLEGLKTMEVR